MTHRLVSLLVLALGLAGCGGEDGDGESSTSAGAMSGVSETPTGGDAMAEDACAAACANLAECGSETLTCEDDCMAGINFIAMNNPGTQCGSWEAGRQQCIAGLTCEQLDAYLQDPNDPMRPCKSAVDFDSQCAIE